jgi:hypothetical protein
MEINRLFVLLKGIGKNCYGMLFLLNIYISMQRLGLDFYKLFEIGLVII